MGSRIQRQLGGCRPQPKVGASGTALTTGASIDNVTRDLDAMPTRSMSMLVLRASTAPVNSESCLTFIGSNTTTEAFSPRIGCDDIYAITAQESLGRISLLEKTATTFGPAAKLVLSF